MREGSLRPALLHHGDDFLEGLTIALLVLDRRAVGPAQRLVLAGLVAAADAAFDPSAADHIEQCHLLGETHRVMPDDDVGALPETNLPGLRGDGHLR